MALSNIFICSTHDDLIKERDAVLDAVRRLQLQHNSMEFFGARPNRPIETCLNEVRRSHVLVVIIAHKYGSCPPQMQVSYTEAEYDEGYNHGRRCLIYIKDNSIPVLPAFFEDDSVKLERLQQFKELLKQRHTPWYFKDEHDLALQVVIDLSRNIHLLEELATNKEEAIQFYSCFISYSNKDEGFAKRLYSRLREENIRVWFAPEDIKGGNKLREQIDRAIQIHDKLIIVLSEASLKSHWVLTEIQRARKAEVIENRRKLFPLRLVSYEAIKEWEFIDPDSGQDLARQLREYFITDFTNWKDYNAFETAFQRLLRDLKIADAV